MKTTTILKRVGLVGLCLSAIFVTAGCAWLNGVGAGSSFACKAPDGVTCNSITGVAANAEAGNLPALQTKHGDQSSAMASPSSQPTTFNVMPKTAIATGVPLRVAPRTLRIWVAPYVDRDGDLKDQSFVYMNIDSGRWLLEHTSQAVQDQYRPVSLVQKSQKPPQESVQTPLENRSSLLPQILEQGKTQ